MENKKIEVKIQSQSSRWFNMIKKRIFSVLMPAIVILSLIAVLYIGFYVLLFIILAVGVSYLIKNIGKRI